MRLWRCSRGLLMECGFSSAAVVESLLSTSRRAWHEPPADYWLVDAQGRVIERFEVTAGSVDDELAATLFVVDDRTLMKLAVHENRGRATCQEIVMLADLAIVPTGDNAGLQQAQSALAHAEEQRAILMEQGRARVAAITGADNDYGAGDALIRRNGCCASAWSASTNPSVRHCCRRWCASVRSTIRHRVPRRH